MEEAKVFNLKICSYAREEKRALEWKQGACRWGRLGKATRTSKEGDWRLGRGDVSVDMGDATRF